MNVNEKEILISYNFSFSVKFALFHNKKSASEEADFLFNICTAIAIPSWCSNNYYRAGHALPAAARRLTETAQQEACLRRSSRNICS